MFQLEDRYWWFVARRRLALGLLQRYSPHPPAPSPSGMGRGGPEVLDLGCGTGVIGTEMAKWALPIGLDMSEKALQYSQSRGLRALVQGRGEAIPIRAESVDAVLALDIFEHIEDHLAAYREAARVLRPGGVLVLSVPAFRALWGPHDVALMHFRRYTRKQVREALSQAGLKVEKASYSVFFLFPTVLVIRFLEKFKRGPAQASLPPVPDWMNAMLIRLQDLEARLIGLGSLPWGSSVVAVARKPR